MQEVKRNQIVSLYPLTKFVWAIVIAVVGALIPSIPGKYLWFCVLCFLAVASGTFGVFIRRVRNFLCVIVLLLVIIHTFFVPGEDIIFQLGILTAQKDGLLYALRLGGNIFCMGGALIWFFTVTTERDFVLALEKAGMSPQASYVILSTLQMVPVMRRRSQVIMAAQQARGVEMEGSLLHRIKVFVPVLVPLILSSIQDIEERALTLEARGFSVETRATHLYDIEVKTADKVVAAVAVLFLTGVVIGRIAVCIV